MFLPASEINCSLLSPGRSVAGSPDLRFPSGGLFPVSALQTQLEENHGRSNIGF